uniref:C-terminal of Roc (COR) domain-containing protein n=1 Tax=Amphimedon queenslandica TaxID=400682 RepID=A0A1X7V3P7_AMPQE
MKDELQELSKELNMDDEKFQEFCRFFTSFGSIIDVSLIDPSSNLIILQPISFLNKLDKLFYYSSGDSVVTSHGFVSKATAEAIFNEKPDENAATFMAFLESLRMATKILPGQVSIDQQGYYIPNVCNHLPLLQCSPTSLHLVHDMNISLSHFKVSFTANFLRSYPKAQLDVSRTPHINVTRFCFHSDDPLFELVYLGDIIEFRFPDLDKELLLEVCENIVKNCHEIMNESDILYNFAIMCATNQHQGSCKLHMERHALPFKDDCERCSAAMSNKDVERIKIFSSILTKHEISEKKILNGEDAAIVSEKLTELSAERAKAVYSEFMGTSSDKDWRDWKVFMQMILTWEEKNKDAKRQFLSKLQSIPFADKSDADKIQQIVNSQIKGQFVYHNCDVSINFIKLRFRSRQHL